MKHALLCLGFALLSSPLLAADHAPEIKTLQLGVKLTVVAEHPDIVTPTGIDVDDHGRVWAVACRTHLPPEDYAGPKKDEILVFDKNGKRSVFYNKTEKTMDLELSTDGWVYLSERARILRIKDSDNDGKADVEEVLITMSSEADYPHNAISGLAWDPNGDLVFGLGENRAKEWTMTATDGGVLKGKARGGIFRMNADGSNLRLIAEGLWNPFGITVRDNGEVFAAENDPGEHPPCKVLHIVQDGDYGFRRQYGYEAHHPFVSWNGEGLGTLPMIHPSGEAPCGVVPLGRGLLMPSWGDHRIDFFPLIPEGASYISKQITLAHGSRYFRPVCIAQDPSQKGDTLVWYLTDWVDGRYPVHGYGRLWKMEIDLEEAAEWIGPLDLEKKNADSELAEKLRSGNHKFSQEQLLQLSTNSDAFIVSAALSALSRLAKDWKAGDVSLMNPKNQAVAVMALKQAGGIPEDSFFDDSNPDVVSEALRWVSDDELNEFLPLVDLFLKRSDLDYRLFEAAVAARNALTGKPEMGIRDPETLLSRILDESSSPSLRAFALRLLPARSKTASKTGAPPVTRFPKGITLAILEKFLEVDDPQLSLETIRTIAANPAVGHKVPAKVAGDENANVNLRAEAIAGLALNAKDKLPLLISLSGNKNQSIREEALRALRTTTLSDDQKKKIKKATQPFSVSSKMAKAITDPASLAAERPALTDIAAWEKRLDAVPQPVDTEAGRRIFYHRTIAICSNCHRHNGRGNTVGPDLSKVSGQGDRTWLLEAILNPNKDIAPQFLPRMITLNDGRVYTGIRLRSYIKEQIRDADGQNHTFDRDDVKSIQDLPMSFMPTGLPMSLTDRELRDLVAFLELSGE